jgi:hypothetical protein
MQKQINRIQQMDQLIRLKATGDSKSFARKIGISESQLFRSLELIRGLGGPVKYCYVKKYYYYERKVRFTFGFFEEE